MIPPRGFKKELYPLRHQFSYSFGLSLLDATKNTTYCPLVKNYKTVGTAAGAIPVNPHNAGFVVETGPVCQNMSIIDKMTVDIDLAYTEDAFSSGIINFKMKWFPIFTSFGDKLDAADEKTTTTVKAILELLSDATEEDVTPIYNNAKLDTTGPAERLIPVSTVNLAETITTNNLDTSLANEGVSLDMAQLFDALKYYTNKGALKSQMGKIRTQFFSYQRNNHKHIRLQKFVPRAVRRIVPYSWFGLAFHIPLQTEIGQTYSSKLSTTGESELGVQVRVQYDEWHPDFYQEMATLA